MQLSAVCAAATVSTRPGRQTEEGCSLHLTLLTRGQHNATNKAEAKKEKQQTATPTMLGLLISVRKQAQNIKSDCFCSFLSRL